MHTLILAFSCDSKGVISYVIFHKLHFHRVYIHVEISLIVIGIVYWSPHGETARTIEFGIVACLFGYGSELCEIFTIGDILPQRASALLADIRICLVVVVEIGT